MNLHSFWQVVAVERQKDWGRLRAHSLSATKELRVLKKSSACTRGKRTKLESEWPEYQWGHSSLACRISRAQKEIETTAVAARSSGSAAQCRTFGRCGGLHTDERANMLPHSTAPPFQRPTRAECETSRTRCTLATTYCRIQIVALITFHSISLRRAGVRAAEKARHRQSAAWLNQRETPPPSPLSGCCLCLRAAVYSFLTRAPHFLLLRHANRRFTVICTLLLLSLTIKLSKRHGPCF